MGRPRSEPTDHRALQLALACCCRLSHWPNPGECAARSFAFVRPGPSDVSRPGLPHTDSGFQTGHPDALRLRMVQVCSDLLFADRTGCCHLTSNFQGLLGHPHCHRPCPAAFLGPPGERQHSPRPPLAGARSSPRSYKDMEKSLSAKHI